MAAQWCVVSVVVKLRVCHCIILHCGPLPLLASCCTAVGRGKKGYVRPRYGPSAQLHSLTLWQLCVCLGVCLSVCRGDAVYPAHRLAALSSVSCCTLSY